jgi:hypothetical protein
MRKSYEKKIKKRSGTKDEEINEMISRLISKGLSISYYKYSNDIISQLRL